MNPDQPQPQPNPNQPQPDPAPAPQPQPELQPQVQPEPQPVSPVGPQVNPTPTMTPTPQPEQQQPQLNPVPPVQPPQEPAKKSKFKKVLLGLLVAGGVLVAAFIALVVVGVVSENQVKTYTKDDLTSMQGDEYSFQYPKQWLDSSDDKKALDSLGLGTDLQDVRLVSDNLDAEAGTADALMVTASSSLGVTDSDLRAGLADAATKAEFENSIKEALEPLAKSVGEALADGSTCTEDASNPAEITYETNGYVAQITSDISCTAGEASDGMHLVVNINIVDGKQYMVVFGAVNKDWDKNSKLYREDVIASFKVGQE